MFTGIVEEIGRVADVTQTATSFGLTIQASIVLDGTVIGDSINVDGVCLTVTAIDPVAANFQVGLAPETLHRTGLGDLAPGDPINLERAVTPATRLGGHYVQGHIDGTGTITAFRPDKDALWVEIACDPTLMPFIVTKGYIAMDGTSLTVVDTRPDGFNVTLIRHTQAHITLPGKPLGARVNLEVDILGKYVDKLLSTRFAALSASGALAP